MGFGVGSEDMGRWPFALCVRYGDGFLCCDRKGGCIYVYKGCVYL